MQHQSGILLQKQSQEIMGHTPAPSQRSRVCDPPLSSDQGNGGQTTISPPAKIHCDEPGEFKVLASGIDTLVLAIDITWNETNFFSYFTQLKEQAKENNEDCAGTIKIPDAGEWPFLMKPFGTNGYEWLIVGNGFTLCIGNWLTPISRPSVIAEIRSQALWELSPTGAISVLDALLKSAGARLVLMKPSRVDLCVDLLMPEDVWVPELMTYRVTRANDAAAYYHNSEMTGLGIGRGKISARLYDKPLEIRKKSKKFWMFDIWKLDEVPDGKKIIRVEFQLRREVLKEFSLETVHDMFGMLANTWAHCSQKWLRFRDRPGHQSHRLKTLQFWLVVQDGFKGAQGAEPLVRVRALAVSKKQLARQAMGLLTSVMAVQHEENDMKLDHGASLISALDAVFQECKGEGDFQEEFADSVRKKRTKHHRIADKAEEGYEERKKLGFPVGKKHRNQTKNKGWKL
jgi:hypothetical protein